VSAFEVMPQAIFGGALLGNRLMKFLFMDEAGTSQHEPVTVVVAIHTDPDSQLVHTEASVRQVLGLVPPQFREGFHFHAKSIWADPKYRDGWDMTKRKAMLCQMMALPRRLGLSISFSIARRGSTFEGHGTTMMPHEIDHLMAFQACIAVADKHIRERGKPLEAASIIAEDEPNMRKFLKNSVRYLRENPRIIERASMLPTAAEEQQGYVEQIGDQRVTNIRNPICFTDKQEEPLVQLADACAYGLKRYFSEQDFGEQFVAAINGCPFDKRDFRGPLSAVTCYWE
jgi:hypothetical protein